ncbi:hypothetical protein KU15F68_33780 [Escherichia coli]
MTVSTEVDHNEYTGNGVTTSFPYTFRIFKKSDLVVQVVDLSENITDLLLDTDYTVTGAGGYTGGNVVLSSPLANGYQISISRELPVTQETDLRNQGKFFAEVHEDAFDKLTMLIQQAISWLRLSLRKPSFVANYYDALGNYIRNLRDPSRPQDAATKNYVDQIGSGDRSYTDSLFRRSLRVPENSIPQIPGVNGRKNKLLAFDSNGDPISVLPESGSASDVLIQLASHEPGFGASLVGAESGMTVQEELDEIERDIARNKIYSHEKNRFNFIFSHYYKRTFNNDLRLQLQSYVDGIYNFAPKSVSLPSGRLVTIYTVKEGANSDPGQDGTPMHIDFMISDDNGVNWTQTGTVVNKGVGYATSETILFLNNNDGYLYCFFTSMKGITGWGHAQQGTDPDTTSTIEYCVSKDRGETWSAPVDITAAVKPAGAYFSSIAPTQAGYINGRPAIPYYYLTTISSGIVEGYITTDDDGNYIYGGDVRKDTDVDTLGTSGGEIGFGNFYDGTPFAIERAADTTIKPYKIAIQKLLMQDSSGKWIVKGQFPTTDCMASFLRVGPDFGFDKDYLFVVAPIGSTGQFEGRANLRLFDCTNDFNNPVDKGMLSVSAVVETGYSSTVLLSSGAMMSVWNGRQWTVNNSIYTVNRLVGNNVIPVPFCGTLKIVDTNRTFSQDIFVNERVIGIADGIMYRWTGSDFVRENAAIPSKINSVVSTLNADMADLFYLDSSSSGSTLTSITGGYIGKTIRILPLSSNTKVTLVKQASGVSVNDRIMYNTSSGLTQYKTNGEIIQLTKTNYGWYLDKSANMA